MRDKRNIPESEPLTTAATDTASALPDPNGPPQPVTPGTAGLLLTQSAAVALAVGSAVVATFGGCSYFNREPTLGRMGGVQTLGRGWNTRAQSPAVETGTVTPPGVTMSASKAAGSSSR